MSLHLLQRNGFAENILRKLKSNEQVSLPLVLRSPRFRKLSGDSKMTQKTCACVEECKSAKTINLKQFR